MTKQYFCTLFDSNYLVKGVAMLRTLRQHCPDAYVYVLCMDELTQELLQRLHLPHIKCISLSEVEDDSLLAVKPSRSMAEYCWTLSPCLPWYLLQINPEIELITYLDADLFFYSSVRPLLDEIDDASIAIIEHRYTPQLRHLEVNGRFCVEWVSFRRDSQGMACLARWREQCLEWCFHRLEDNRMGDQKYLDKWPEHYDGVHIIQHLGAGLAPWNYSQFVIEKNGMGQITVSKAPLIFYHFHQFQMLADGSFDRLSKTYTMYAPEPECVYEVYEKAVSEILREIRLIKPGFSYGIKSVFRVKSQRFAQYFLPTGLKKFLKKFIKAV